MHSLTPFDREKILLHGVRERNGIRFAILGPLIATNTHTQPLIETDRAPFWMVLLSIRGGSATRDEAFISIVVTCIESQLTKSVVRQRSPRKVDVFGLVMCVGFFFVGDLSDYERWAIEPWLLSFFFSLLLLLLFHLVFFLFLLRSNFLRM